MTRRALIAGAGIAGQTTAIGLAEAGWDVRVIERFPSLRTGGQNVDIRGAGRQVIERMGLADQVTDLGTGEVGTRFVDRAGRVLAEFTQDGTSAGGATAEWEILRGQLSQLLADRSPASIEYSFDSSIEEVEDVRGRPLSVRFADGTHDEYDVVIIAEGIGSRTRTSLAARFGGVQRRQLGISIAYFSIDRAASDDQWWNWYNAPEGRSVTLRPDNVGRTRATLSFRSDPVGTSMPDADAKALLTRRFHGAGWQTPRMIDELARVDDLYLDDIGQIRMSRWSSGRVVLVGDAAYCASPVSGMGTTLALVGGHVLAGELARHDSVDQAFGSYERTMRPYVERAQKLPPGAPGVMHPRTRFGVAALQTAFRLAGSGILRPFERKLFHPPADRFLLPEYSLGG